MLGKMASSPDVTIETTTSDYGWVLFLTTLMVVGSIPYGVSIELFLVPASAPQLV